ncbi:Beta-lactamase-like protein sdnR, partial [Fusarium oxysporum f. sp. albedinis]
MRLHSTWIGQMRLHSTWIGQMRLHWTWIGQMPCGRSLFVGVPTT